MVDPARIDEKGTTALDLRRCRLDQSVSSGLSSPRSLIHVPVRFYVTTPIYYVGDTPVRKKAGE